MLAPTLFQARHDPREEMRIYDGLPKNLRDALKEHSLSATSVQPAWMTLLAKGYSRETAALILIDGLKRI